MEMGIKIVGGRETQIVREGFTVDTTLAFDALSFKGCSPTKEEMA